MIEQEKEIDMNGNTYVTLTFKKSFDINTFQEIINKIRINKGFFISKIKKWVIPKNNWDDLLKSLQEIFNRSLEFEKEQEEITKKFLSEYDQK